MRLILAEKPSMGQAIAGAIGLKGKGNGCIEGTDAAGNPCIVTWARGHLVEYVDPDAYDPALKRWSWDPLPFIPGKWRSAPIASTKDQWGTVKHLLSRQDVSEVVNATDAGREGEAIFKLIYDLAGCKKPVRRLWTSSLTDTAIREAYGRLKPWPIFYSKRGVHDRKCCICCTG